MSLTFFAFSASNYNYKKVLKCSAVITLFYVATSVILYFSLFKVYNAVLTIGLIYLAIQVADMLLYSVKANMQTFLQLEYSPTKSTIINLFCKGLRTVLSILIISPYNTNIAQIVCGAVSLLLFAILRFKCFKLDKTGFLIRKVKQQAAEQPQQEEIKEENSKTDIDKAILL